MIETDRNKFKFINDLLWYFLGSGIPALIALIRIPVFTRIFSPEEFGNYTLVFISFNYLSLILFSWLGTCIYRYYHQLKDKDELDQLYSSVLKLLFPGTAILFLFTLIWVLSASQSNLKTLILAGSIFVFLSQIKLLLVIPLKIEDRASYVNSVLTVNAIINFAILLVLTFVYHFGIEAFFISAASAEFLFIIILSSKINIRLTSALSGKATYIKQFLKYGSVAVLTNLGAMMLVAVDRYIINIFSGTASVGIYNQIYSITQMGLQTFILVFFNAINPVVLKELSGNQKGLTVLKPFLFRFLLIFVPITFFFSIYAKQIATILLGQEFREGYTMIPLVALSTFVGGIIMFYELWLKFRDQYKKLILGYLGAVTLNILSNLILIPLFGYKIAAATSLLSYLFLLIYFLKSSSGFLGKDSFNRAIVRMCFILAGQFIFHYLLGLIVDNIFISIAEGLLFVVTYFFLIKKFFWETNYEMER